MEEILLIAEKRAVIGKQVRALRRQGKLPGVIYGRGTEPTPISLNLHDATRTLTGVASSALITLELGGERHMALVREKQRDVLRGTLKHIDFQVVSMREKLRLPVGVQVTGIAPAVTDFNGVLVNGLEEIEVECLPSDIPEAIVVDISSLKKIGDAIYVRDVTPPANVEFLSDPGDMIVLVTGQAAEEVEEVAAVPEAEIAGGEPEVIEKGKKEEEEF